MQKRIAAVFVGIILVAAGAWAQDMQARPVPQSPEWDKLKTLVGQWEGTMGADKTPTILEVRLTGDGSAVMHVMGRNTPYEMVTMFHPDGKRLIATHYCAAHNQPRMALVPSKAPNQVSFDFIDGTNIGPGEGHMRRLTITFVDADHHEEAWTFGTAEKQMPAEVFRYTRKK